MLGDNTEMDRKEFFFNLVGEMFIDYVNDHFDFYKKVEDPKISMLIMVGLYKKYRRDVFGSMKKGKFNCNLKIIA
jgi:type I restriction enzyme, R subunit